MSKTNVVSVSHHGENTDHRGRNERYSFQVDLDHGSSILQFMEFLNQNVANILFLVVKSLEVTSGFISKLMKKILDGATIEKLDI